MLCAYFRLTVNSLLFLIWTDFSKVGGESSIQGLITSAASNIHQVQCFHLTIMAASSNIMTSKFFMATSPSSWNSTNKSKICLQQIDASSNTNGKMVKFTRDSSLKVKLQAQALLTNDSRATSMIESLKDEEMMTSPPATMEHLTTEGRLINDGLVFQQNFSIRSFEIDSEYKVSARAIMNYLQESSLNHRKKMGMSSDSLVGVTPEMIKRDLLWIFRGMCIEVDRYPSWADVVQIYHRIYTSGRTGLRLEWIVNDSKTGETLVRASCLAVMMNKKTRKTCKFPEEVKQELKPYLTTDAEPLFEADKILCPQVGKMDNIRTGLTSCWHDLDFNYHVNNAKYLDWILEGTPTSLIHSHELSRVSLQYRKECLKDDVIQSLSRVVTKETGLSTNNQEIELEHVLRLESGPELAGARTAWRPKSICRQTIN
ncbi:Acyl-ACP thioesterase - like 5 [Theobroma cacao]|nr:Acyl-ACP thioesterase - like 5 [Theobroma cacao]